MTASLILYAKNAFAFNVCMVGAPCILANVFDLAEVPGIAGM